MTYFLVSCVKYGVLCEFVLGCSVLFSVYGRLRGVFRGVLCFVCYLV